MQRLMCRFIRGATCGNCFQEKGRLGWIYPAYSFCTACLVSVILIPELEEIKKRLDKLVKQE